MKKRLLQIFLFLLATSLLPGCGEKEQIVEEIRSIKTVTLSMASTTRTRRFSGIVQAVNSAALSFEVGGLVDAVNVDIGDRVIKGQVLAVLDKEPYQLKVASADAELVRSKANLTNKDADYLREKSVFEKGAGSKRRLDQARFGFEEAEAGIQYAVSRLNLAKRDLRKTVLYAPYDGHIGLRLVDPHVEVRVGQPTFEIEGEGAREVQADIPETIISQLSVGAATTITFNILPGTITQGTIGSISTQAGEANAFPVKVTLIDPPTEIQSGMTAEVTFALEAHSDVSGYLIPPQAFILGKEHSQGDIFVYDSATSTVKKTRVKIVGSQNNQVLITEGVSEGDIVATAGVSFLSDGEKVHLMRPAQKRKPEKFKMQ